MLGKGISVRPGKKVNWKVVSYEFPTPGKTVSNWCEIADKRVGKGYLVLIKYWIIYIIKLILKNKFQSIASLEH